MKEFKVWIEIEQCDEARDEYVNLDAPDSAVATFSTYREAWDFAERLQRHGYVEAGWPKWADVPPAQKRKGRR